MEFWKEVRRRVLTHELSQRAACAEYGLGWHTLQKILAHTEPPGIIVRMLLESGPMSYVILGGSHDLAENVERLSGGKAEYLRMELEAWGEFSEP
ncbi:MAG: hypothetical protein WEB58_01840 [Planctomycetaceae bacterium]